MESYLLKSGIALLCFYIAYYLFVRHNSNFKLNRMIILSSLLAASVFPFISFDIGQQYAIVSSIDPIIYPGTAGKAVKQSTDYSIEIFSIVYIGGLLYLAIRSITGLATLLYMYSKFPIRHHKGFKVVLMQRDQNPFTFFNLLFVNKEKFETQNVDELIIHEKAHQNQWHSLDLILMEVLTAIHWFNPLIWLFKHDLKAEHEFYADEQVIKKGVDLSRYQKLLFQSNVGLSMYLANYFNNSILKTRLKMMTIEKSKSKVKTKYSIGIPLLLVSMLILIFSFQIKDQETVVPEVMPEYNGGTEALYTSIQKSIKYPSEARKNNVQGQVLVSFTVNAAGEVAQIKADDRKYNMLKEIVVVGYGNESTPEKISYDKGVLQTECERVVGLLGKFTPGTKDGKAVDTRLTLPITFKLD